MIRSGGTIIARGSIAFLGTISEFTTLINFNHFAISVRGINQF